MWLVLYQIIKNLKIVFFVTYHNSTSPVLPKVLACGSSCLGGTRYSASLDSKHFLKEIYLQIPAITIFFHNF